MKSKYLLAGFLVAAGAAGMLFSRGQGTANAQAQGAPQSEIAALRAEIDVLRRLVPDQAHAMADVDYHFANLWFAAQAANWALADFYLDETRSHLNWAARIRPLRKLSSGAELDVRAILQGVEQSSLSQLKTAIGRRDHKSFEIAYRQAVTECYGCHKAAEKPYLRPHIPEAPATRMINLSPSADWPQ
jgi:hypothetical protein